MSASWAVSQTFKYLIMKQSLQGTEMLLAFFIMLQKLNKQFSIMDKSRLEEKGKRQSWDSESKTALQHNSQVLQVFNDETRFTSSWNVTCILNKAPTSTDNILGNVLRNVTMFAYWKMGRDVFRSCLELDG